MLSVHVIDGSFGMPAADVDVVLRRQVEAQWRELTRGQTDVGGRLAVWRGRDLELGIYQLIFDLDRYYAMLGVFPLYPRAIVEFRVTDPDTELHLPLVITANSYLTYRGAS